jgi:hypothetical protein
MKLDFSVSAGLQGTGYVPVLSLKNSESIKRRVKVNVRGLQDILFDSCVQNLIHPKRNRV